MRVRDYTPDDAIAVAELYNNHPDNPNPVRGGITAEQFQTELDERGTQGFLVAVDDGQVVGTFGMFATNGRHSVGEHESFADMFFVAPAYRRTTLTGTLFAAAVEALFARGMHVLRLTVNPANTPAFRLYRRVGCVSLGGHGPGEDANVELHNYIPLILATIRDDMGDQGRRALAAMTSFGCITEQRSDHLAADTVQRDGRTVVEYDLDLGMTRVRATVDVETVSVVNATIASVASDDEACLRTVRITGDPVVSGAQPGTRPGAGVALAPTASRHQLSRNGLTVTLDAGGALSITHDHHWGPLVSTTWPSAASHRSAGWRQGLDVQLDSRLDGDTWTISDSEGVSCRVRIEDQTVVQQFGAGSDSQLRLFQQCGLRQGLLTATTADGDQLSDVSVGLDVAIRDASEVTAASLPLDPGQPVAWTQGDSSVQSVEVGASGRVSLVHSALIDRRLHTDQHGHVRLETTVVAGADLPEAITTDLPEISACDESRFVLDPRAGGVTVWRDGSTKVVRSPWPRSQRIGCNPLWRSGMWVTREADRHDRRHGMGWGLDRSAWQVDDATITASDGDLGWTFDDGPHGCTVDVTSRRTDGELVVWFTPATPATGEVKASDHGTTTVLDLATTWQRWATKAAIPLRHGRWLLVEADADRSDHPEMLLRSTAQGLLVGCISRAAPGTASWRFYISAALPAHNPRRNDYTLAS